LGWYIVRKGDVIIAKNYLTVDEIDTLNRLVTIFLEAAELRVKERHDLTLVFWRQNVDLLLQFQSKAVLSGKGKITNAEMEEQVRKIYDQFNQRRKAYEAKLADQDDLIELRQLEEQVKAAKGS
jgi:hypothetical protein